jgi:hypothetical protein
MRHLSRKDSGLSLSEHNVFAELSSPIKVQDFLDTLPMNWEKKGDTHMSPRRVLREGKAHCIEGALFASVALWMHGEPPIIMNLSARLGKGDDDHVVALYKKGGCWGAISKTNHAVLRFRDPIYRTPRELAISYFHEWFMNKNGEKVLECYSKPLNLKSFGTDWITSEKDLWHIADALSERKHYFLVPKGNWKFVRKADSMELKAGKIIEWPRSHPLT